MGDRSTSADAPESTGMATANRGDYRNSITRAWRERQLRLAQEGGGRTGYLELFGLWRNSSEQR